MFKPYPKKEPHKPKSAKPLKRTPIKKKYKATGELIVFQQVYARENGFCQVTKMPMAFNVSCFCHILSKGSNPKLRLLLENIIFADFEFHYAYDNLGKEQVLKKFPNAGWVYELKEKLKQKHNGGESLD